MSGLKPISELKPHQCGLVDSVDADSQDAERLKAMGVCAGRTVELLQVGDPLILKVYGTRIGVSARLAHSIQVRICTRDGCPINLPEEL